MVSLRLQRFCCCCTLRTGSLIIGTVGWIFTLMELIGFTTTKTKTESSTGNYSKWENDDDDEDDLNTFLKGMDKIAADDYGYEIGYGVVTLIVCVLLIWAVYKKDRRFMLPWLVLKCFEAILIVIITFVILIGACVAAGHVAGGVLGVIFVIMLIASVLTWYFWLCVWSLYMSITEEIVPPVYYSTTSPPPAYEKQFQLA